MAKVELKVPDRNREFVVQADLCKKLSKLGFGAVLLQERDSILQSVTSASWSLNATECNHCVTERACFTIFFALQKLDCNVDAVQFVVETDHVALTWLKHLHEPLGRFMHWVLTLQQ